MRTRVCTGWMAALVLVVATGGDLARSAAADEGSTETDPQADRLARLERRLGEQASEIEGLRRQLAGAAPAPAPATAAFPAREGPALQRDAVDADLAGAAAAAPMAPAAPGLVPALGGLRLGGYLTVEYVAPSHRSSYADLHRLVLSLDAPLGERIGLTSEIEIEHGGVDGFLDGEIKVEFAEVQLMVADALVPKVGVLLIPFGRFNLHHDDPLNDFTMRPFTARYLVPTGFGQPGVGAEGAFPLGRGAITYDVAVTAGFDDGFTTASGAREARQAWKGDSNEAKQVWARVAARPRVPALDGIEIGVSGTWARYDDDGDRDLLGLGLDGLLQVGPWELKGEWLLYDLERAASAPDGDPRRQWGLWVEVAWHFMPPAWRCPRAPFVTDTSHFTLAGRFQAMDLNARLRGGSLQDDLEAWSVGLNYRIRESMVFRVDWTWFDAAQAEDRQELTASFSTCF